MKHPTHGGETAMSQGLHAQRRHAQRLRRPKKHLMREIDGMRKVSRRPTLQKLKNDKVERKTTEVKQEGRIKHRSCRRSPMKDRSRQACRGSSGQGGQDGALFSLWCCGVWSCQPCAPTLVRVGLAMVRQPGCLLRGYRGTEIAHLRPVHGPRWIPRYAGTRANLNDLWPRRKELPWRR